MNNAKHLYRMNYLQYKNIQKHLLQSRFDFKDADIFLHFGVRKFNNKKLYLNNESHDWYKDFYRKHWFKKVEKIYTYDPFLLPHGVIHVMDKNRVYTDKDEFEITMNKIFN